MKRASLVLTILLSLAGAFVGVSCTSSVPPGLPTVAIAIRTVGDRPPSTEEIRQIHQALQPALLRAGALVAESREAADFVLTVSFTPATDSSGPSVTVTGVEPTARIREAADGRETPEAKAWRRRLGEIEQWIERQGRSTDT